jgi:glycosyltransferase involved in cell wall biosynthesis
VDERILHVCESTVGGVGVVIAELARDQVARGSAVAVAAPAGGPFLDDLAAGGVHVAAWDARAQPGPWVAREFAALARIVRDFDPTLVHLHSSKAGLVGRMLVRRRRPTILQPHSWSFWARTGAVAKATLGWERLAARWTDVVLCVSDEERRVGEQSGIRTHYRVLPNGANLERFQPGDRPAARAALGVDPDVPLIACVGRLHRQKNQGALLDVWERVRAAVPGARLALVGDGPDREQLEARAPDGVDFVGSVDDVRPWLAAANAIAQPSRWEGMSLALLEALASGRSVVVTDVQGMREVVVDGVGAVVPPEDPDALLAALVERLRDPERADEEGRAGRRHVEANHDRRVQLDAVAALYEELLDDRRRSSTSSDSSAIRSFARRRS